MEQYFVDVWQGNLTLSVDEQQHFAGLLQDDERQKAQTMRLSHIRDRYIATRAWLRLTLAAYLQETPASLRFDIGEYGKPSLAGVGLHFNLSHSADTLLLAVANFADIGVDVEEIKPRGSLADIACRCFSAREFADWQQLPPSQQIAVFYNLWTKKEAFVKAVGRGIALGVEQCEVSLQAGGGLNAIPAEFGHARDWTVTELAMPAGMCAALVTANGPFELRRRSLSISNLSMLKAEISKEVPMPGFSLV